ncbi:P-loop containing nucleoside triphosphate hydrolase protein [Thamnocephalis sphaerospora]|uniref:P-loop containing nucleoside triphosphate hydrolase protein n=1 Tax=Thamnocephalis sphaerospora TaxID=78915 RepID=A0A4V1IXA4_9FUNG|nr:P-loop containing nucleoside triphosphate hydrolase protein [Thamnocephalis sphaerospora]|eukprot:RKP10369.1 P-loop containing nucleoside triphosphate hydrolase protein [Thamnocephalis sphaerospora]
MTATAGRSGVMASLLPSAARLSAAPAVTSARRLASTVMDKAGVQQDKGEEQTLSKRKQLMRLVPSEEINRRVGELRLGLVKKTRFRRREKEEARAKYEKPHGPGIELPMLMFFAGAKTPASFPPATLPEIALVGRSNVGKSSLINALARTTSTARVSDKPGFTQQINFFTAGRYFHLVDMPGYGFAYAKQEAVESWQHTIDVYFAERQSLKRIYVLIDARHGLKANDKEFLQHLDRCGVKYRIILTKCDLVLREVLAKRCQLVVNELAEMQLRFCVQEPLMLSAKLGPGVDALRRDILHIVRANHLLPKPASQAEKKPEKRESLKNAKGRAGSSKHKRTPPTGAGKDATRARRQKSASSTLHGKRRD